eukprot:CAMPEP_0198364500 /NCGR_PEP_ID=MMETSP1450-20131203/153644_1 /TAXON_ID=753684 ORGANISM="Madagascaria erythrocladiodes, Strain CCMP3234" /NCGR_SAMPLE_ID=MMETSP1450 /ASSEMBLY_ACC=CAM_ASM_001115 /LENGTH=37 /DNA_ID= /DNA_START= /DNA_END= /DNA_ORIENTATION=
MAIPALARLRRLYTRLTKHVDGFGDPFIKGHVELKSD